MSAEVVPLRKPAQKPVQARGAAALPDARPKSLPASGVGPARLAGDKSGTPSPAAIGLNGEPLYDAPPGLPSSDVYAVAPGVVWYRQPAESEPEFSARVRAGALAAGLSHVTRWRSR
jgi:hypothetical protein